MKNTKYETISAKEAEDRGDCPITTAYRREEYPLLDKAIETLGKKRYVLVRTRDGIVIARPGHEVNLIKV